MLDKDMHNVGDILLVDDRPENLRLLSQMLTKQGYTVRAVTSGKRALESAQTTSPSLILLDIKMPEMNGYEVCEQLKQNSNTSDIPVIFISALDDLQDKMRGFSIGGVDYITKPFHVEEVLARVKTHLSLRSLQKKLQDANRRYQRELALAGSVQASFFPSKPPDVAGWQISMTLKPAKETSGDYYDVFKLQDGNVAILVGDVVDKGAAAALYMALSWTLIRTYAEDFPLEPERALDAVNRRIISDTDATRFVTVFLGILDPITGRLVYCNAGHNPPLLLRSHDHKDIEKLTKTGTPLGMLEDQKWAKGIVELEPQDLIVLYSDGVTEAENSHGEFFQEDRLVKTVKRVKKRKAEIVQEAILETIHTFMEGAPQSDDIALVVLLRE